MRFGCARSATMSLDRAFLRRRQRIGQCGDDACAQQSLGGTAASGALAHMAAQQRQRELAGKQFVVSKPRPRRASRLEVVRAPPGDGRAQRLGKAGKAVALAPGGILPFRQIRHAVERGVDRLAQLVGVQPFGERIDRIDQRQLGKTGRVDHAVRDAPSADGRRRA